MERCGYHNPSSAWFFQPSIQGTYWGEGGFTLWDLSEGSILCEFIGSIFWITFLPLAWAAFCGNEFHHVRKACKLPHVSFMRDLVNVWLMFWQPQKAVIVKMWKCLGGGRKGIIHKSIKYFWVFAMLVWFLLFFNMLISFLLWFILDHPWFYNLLSCPLINSVSPGWKVQVCHLCPFASSNSASFFELGDQNYLALVCTVGSGTVILITLYFLLVTVLTWCLFVFFPHCHKYSLPGLLMVTSEICLLSLQCLIWSPLFGGYSKSCFPSWAILCWHRI